MQHIILVKSTARSDDAYIFNAPIFPLRRVLVAFWKIQGSLSMKHAIIQRAFVPSFRREGIFTGPFQAVWKQVNNLITG